MIPAVWTDCVKFSLFAIAVALISLIFFSRVLFCSDDFQNSQGQLQWSASGGSHVTNGTPAASGSSVLAEAEPSEEDIRRLVHTFQASDPEYQSRCLDALQKGKLQEKGMGSQHFQDVFIFFNIFLKMTMAGRKGFYIESGANDWAILSNSVFYDKCLGWDGLCIEPQSMYHDGHRQHRSCTLVPECISNKRQQVSLFDQGPTGAMRVNASGKISCGTVHEILARVNRSYVDLWLLDVEGHEDVILQAVDWEKLRFTAVLVEMPKDDIWKRFRMDYFFMEKGFVKFQQVIDNLYVSRQWLSQVSLKPWLPPKKPFK